MDVIELIHAHAKQTEVLKTVAATLEWDERTYLPADGGSYRAEQLTVLSGLLHQRATDAKYGTWLNEASEDIEDSEFSEHTATIRILRRDFDRATRVPQRLVEELTRNSIEGQQAWVEARKQRDFKILMPHLKLAVKLNVEKAEALGYDECAYDALLDEFEPNTPTSYVSRVFADLRQRISPLLNDIVASRVETPASILARAFPIDVQRKISRVAAKKIGFDFARGRIDETNHPFCTTLGPDDIRLTTRYDERSFATALFGTLHEAGHGIYEQGLRTDWFGLPPGKHCSMAIHESQSRLWENLVGRSQPFWEHFFPEVQAAFPQVLPDVDSTRFFEAVNEVKPSLIRVEADEVTYNLHIIIRFELEQALIHGELAVEDLPEAWNAKYQEFLGISPPHDGDGVLQDIHWSAGCFGYFPTYALGNLYAAQFFDQAETDLGDLGAMFREGVFLPLRGWLQEHVHHPGQTYPAADLVRLVTKNDLSAGPLIRRLRAKMEPIYRL